MISISNSNNDALTTIEPVGPSLDSLPTEEFLRIVGLRVRGQRSSMSMSRKRLAEVSGVSERYLAQLESGQGNMSIALLRKVTTAIDMSLACLLAAETPELAAPVGRLKSYCTSDLADGNPQVGQSKDDVSQTSTRMVREPEL